MANTKKELIKSAENLIEDIFDHYDDYSQEDKQKVQNLMYSMKNLNIDLDKYDKKNKSKNIFEKFSEWVGNFFGKN